MSKEANCIVFYGDFKSTKTAWDGWLSLAQELVKSIDIEFTHLGVSSEKSFKNGKIVQIKRANKRLLDAIESGENVESVEFYSLPSEFKQAAFDYKFHAVLEASPFPFLYLASVGRDFDNQFFEGLRKLVSDFFLVSEGIIFSMDKYESPYMFASKMNQPSSYKSLRIIKKKTFT